MSSFLSTPFYPKGEGKQHSLVGEEVWDPIRTTGKKAWHFVYSVHVPEQNDDFLQTCGSQLYKTKEDIFFSETESLTALTWRVQKPKFWTSVSNPRKNGILLHDA
jgi:hypothetical protein